MKTGIKIFAMLFTVSGIMNVNAQGRGNGNGKGHGGHGNPHANSQQVVQQQRGNRGGNDRDVIYRRDDDNRYRTQRGGTVSYPRTTRRDGRVYRGDDRIYRGDDRVYRNDRIYRGGASNLPPGQAKKIYGHQSAKAFAPGQQKKNSHVYYPYPQRSSIFSSNRRYYDRYDDRYDRVNAGAAVATRIGSLFGL